MKTFDAQYPGWCYNCEGRIHEGDTIRYAENNRIVHDRCDDDLTLARAAVVCDRCFILKPCECDD